MLACLTVVATLSAQFGHPLTGSWSGDWGTSKDQRNRVLLDIQWDGKALRGTLNGAPLAVATVNPETWAVRFEAETKDSIRQYRSFGSRRQAREHRRLPTLHDGHLDPGLQQGRLQSHSEPARVVGFRSYLFPNTGWPKSSFFSRWRYRLFS